MQALSDALTLDFKRSIHARPASSDLIGTQIYNPKEHILDPRGPVFTDVVLADEINRAPAKVQSALLEAMQERRVTMDGRTILSDAFMVLATQNPIEQEGTYPLEAQADRFLMKVRIDYRQGRGGDPPAEVQCGRAGDRCGLSGRPGGCTCRRGAGPHGGGD